MSPDFVEDLYTEKLKNETNKSYFLVQQFVSVCRCSNNKKT